MELVGVSYELICARGFIVSSYQCSEHAQCRLPVRPLVQPADIWWRSRGGRCDMTFEHVVSACCQLFCCVSETRMLAYFIITEIRGVTTGGQCALYGTGIDSWTLRGGKRCIQGFGG
jgi:hypothetical protein